MTRKIWITAQGGDEKFPNYLIAAHPLVYQGINWITFTSVASMSGANPTNQSQKR